MKIIKAFTVVAGVALLLTMAACKSGGTILPEDKAPVVADGSAHLKRITFSTSGNETTIKLYGSRRFTYTSYKLSDPLRLAVEIPNVVLDFQPRRVKVDSPAVSHITVVPFPKVNSIRVEMDMQADFPFQVTQRTDHLEVNIIGLEGVASPKTASSSPDAGKADSAASGAGGGLQEENERLKNESLAARKQNIALEEENGRLKLELEESRRQLQEAASLATTLQARIDFMEKQVGDIKGKMAEAVPPKAVSSIPGPGDDAETASAREFLTGWLKAWNGQDIDSYSVCYADEFTAGGMGKEEWLRDKGAKFAAQKSISIEITDPEISLEDFGAKAVFVQSYTSSSYSDRGKKTLVLTKVGKEWKILSESWEAL